MPFLNKLTYFFFKGYEAGNIETQMNSKEKKFQFWRTLKEEKKRLTASILIGQIMFLSFL